MRNETWVIAAPRLITTTIASDAARSAGPGAGPEGSSFGDGRGPVATVSAAVNAGSVRVEVWDRLDVELEVLAVSERSLVASLSDDEFQVSYEFAGIEGLVDRVKGLRNKDSADIVLRVPHGAAVKVSTLRASVSIEGVDGPVTVSSVDGAVEIHGAAASVNVSTVAGIVHVTDHRGAVNVKTGTGAIELGGQLTRAEVNTVSGAVSVQAGTRASLISAKTVSSTVALRLPLGVGVDLHARSVSGTVLLDGANLKRPGARTALVDHVEADATTFLSTSTISGDVLISRGD